MSAHAAAWTDLCAADALRPETARRVDLGGRTYAVFRGLDDGYYCSDGLCPHEAAHLARGTVSGTRVECPRHGLRFDLASGRRRGLPACPDLMVYPVRLRHGRVEALIPKDDPAPAQ